MPPRFLPPLPHLPKPPHLPPPPRLSSFLRGNNPVRQILDDGHELIRSAREEIRSVASVLHVEQPNETIRAVRETLPSSSSAAASTLVERLKPVTETKSPESKPASEVTERKSPGVTDAQTLQYQNDGLVDELSELETRHLPAGGKILGASCDCIAKHSRAVRRLAKESIPIAARQGKDPSVYAQMVEWAEDMMKIGTKAAVDSGEYKDRYALESGTASKFRKALESDGKCPTCKPPKRLSEFLKGKDA